MALSDLTATMRAFVQWSMTKDVPGLEDQSHAQDATIENAFTFGTSTDQINQLYAAVRTLNAAATEDLDLSGSALQNPLGENIAFATVKFVLVWLLGTSDTAPGDDTITGTAASAITIGNDAASPQLWFGAITHTIQVKNGGFFAYAIPGAGYTITNTTADVFQVVNNDATLQAKYLLVIGGTA